MLVPTVYEKKVAVVLGVNFSVMPIEINTTVKIGS